jgi:hypothetical protein
MPFDGHTKDAEQAYELLSSRYEALISSKGHLFADAPYSDMTFATEGVHLISNPTGLYAKEPVVYQTLHELMLLADREVIIHSPYAVLNGYISISPLTPERTDLVAYEKLKDLKG